ncbi:large subunit GTPase 1 [Kwoniella heveanensis BCC8398]|uniref:Large subunit GTPase 1 n=1 Tax=Kwoniella heveanensis BCC8398 TaxID=1296120 RepID=A0A1B9GSY6_9TREE|nr:large subunit GTPase 1 [Kwoniella heveanensis BCC8398]
MVSQQPCFEVERGPLQRTKAQGSGLGKALINRKAKEAVAPKESQLYTLDESNPLQSITHERDLDEFLANAALADADFTTERTKMKVISAPNMPAPSTNPFLLSAQEEKEVAKKKMDMSGELRVPRRPPWTRQMTRLELERQERDSFLDWRRELAQLAERSNLLMTPFERNIQLWRQLWRVLERSHLVVQIVDARNPMGFRCADLETYVQEIGTEEGAAEITVPGKGKRKSLLLINKADLLTFDQRSKWADYFEQNGISYAFFSAANAAALQEQAEKQRQRAAGEYDEVDNEDKDEEEDDRASQEEEFVSGEEVEPQSDEDRLAKKVEETNLGDEEGWSTEGEEADEVAPEGAAEEKLAQGERVPLEEVARDVAEKHGTSIEEEVEDIRTRVLTVTELEDLFLNAAPDLSHFATPQMPNPEKLMVGLVGYPNVGKSSTINALLGAKKVSVSATPGKTKHFQTLVLSDTVTLCDCPGLVFPQFANTQADMVVDGVLPIDQMREYSAPVDLLCRRIPREILEGTYGLRIDVREVEDGGSGKVGWEELLSTYAIARGMTRSSFGMPDTSRAARYVLKDYVNAKLLYAHPPPGQDADEFMAVSREKTLAKLEEAFENGRKRAPVSHVSKNADTYVRPAPSAGASHSQDVEEGEAQEGEQQPQQQAQKHRQLTSKSVRANAASAPMRSGREKAAALDSVYFTEAGAAPRLVVKGRNQQLDMPEGGSGQSYARQTIYPHQRRLGPDGMPIVGQSGKGDDQDGGNSKKHFKRKEGKKRSGRGYD